MTPPLIVIAAMTRDRVIGRGDALPWRIPEEYAKFLGFVRGNVVLMGRRSYEIFGPDLDDARLVVVSRSATRLRRAEVFPTLDAALAHARTLGPPVFSAGGATVYRQTVPLADAMYLSIVKGEYAGDAHFPEFDDADWEIVRTENHDAFEFREYRRRGVTT